MLLSDNGCVLIVHCKVMVNRISLNSWGVLCEAMSAGARIFYVLKSVLVYFI